MPGGHLQRQPCTSCSTRIPCAAGHPARPARREYPALLARHRCRRARQRAHARGLDINEQALFFATRAVAVVSPAGKSAAPFASVLRARSSPTACLSRCRQHCLLVGAHRRTSVLTDDEAVLDVRTALVPRGSNFGRRGRIDLSFPLICRLGFQNLNGNTSH